MACHDAISRLPSAVLTIGRRLRFAEVPQLARPRANHVGAELARKPRRRRVGTDRKRKDMEVCERQGAEKRKRGAVVLIRFSGKSGDHIGSQTKDRQPFRQPLDARPIRLRRIPVPPHALEDAVGARLQWRV